MTNAIDTGLGFYRQALALRGYRQEILSADIANASTPGFKAVDLNFTQALSSALGRDAPAAPPQTTGSSGRPTGLSNQPDENVQALLVSDPRHLSLGGISEPDTGAATGAAAATAVQYQASTQSTIDGNTVDLDQEKLTAAGNAVDYAATATFATQTIKMLLTAMGSPAQTGGGA